MRRRPFEDHVLQQVGHARFAVAFVPRADEHGHVHGDRRPRMIGIEQQPQAVVELVLGDAFDGRDLLWRRLFRAG